jgi:hypothetical protein
MQVLYFPCLLHFTQGNAKMHPNWPPKQVLVNGGTAPTFGHLKRSVASALLPRHALLRAVHEEAEAGSCVVRDSAALSSSSSSSGAGAGAVQEELSDAIHVYKYQPQAIEWAPVIVGGLAGGGAGAVSSGAAKKRSSSGGAGSNITAAPHFIKEGDQFCAFEASAIRRPHAATYAQAPSQASHHIDNTITIALPEDLLLRNLRETERQQRKSAKSAGGGGYRHVTGRGVAGAAGSGGVGGGEGSSSKGGGAKSGARREVMLSLGSNFDFSDDD